MPVADHTSEIVQRYESGETMASIARDYGCSREYIRQVLAKQGVTAKRRAKSTLDTMKQMADEGMSAASIAAVLGTSRASVYSFLAWRGEKAFPDKKRALTPTVLRMYDEGMSRKEIAEELAIPYANVTARLYRNGRSTRNRRYQKQPGDYERFLSMHQSGMTQYQIADEVGCTQSCVAQTLKRGR